MYVCVHTYIHKRHLLEQTIFFNSNPTVNLHNKLALEEGRGRMKRSNSLPPKYIIHKYTLEFLSRIKQIKWKIKSKIIMELHFPKIKAYIHPPGIIINSQMLLGTGKIYIYILIILYPQMLTSVDPWRRTSWAWGPLIQYQPGGRLPQQRPLVWRGIELPPPGGAA